MPIDNKCKLPARKLANGMAIRVKVTGMRWFKLGYYLAWLGAWIMGVELEVLTSDDRAEHKMPDWAAS